MTSENPQIDEYLIEGCGRCPLGGTPECKVHRWTAELRALRSIVLSCGLTEELKWGVPCYTYQKKNVIIVSAFKENCVLSFIKGALLQDNHKLLEKPGKNSQSGRVIKFTGVAQITEREDVLKAYIFDAIEVEKSGKQVDFKAKNELKYPEELLTKFEEMPRLQKAFEALTPGHQRGYILHFTQPKQSKTRVSRIEKNVPKILNGKGFHDR